MSPTDRFKPTVPTQGFKPLQSLRWLWMAVACVAMGTAGSSVLRADSALELLSGFDQQQVADAAAWLSRPEDPETQAHVARLLYQLRRVGHQGLLNRLPPSPQHESPQQDTIDEPAWQPGDVIHWTGDAIHVSASPVPQTQAEVLEMPRVFRFELQGSNRYVIAPSVPSLWLRPEGKQHAHRVAVVGIVVRVDPQTGQPSVVAAPRVQWFPGPQEHVPGVGWRLLATQGFDCGRFDTVLQHDKQALTAEEPFYELLAAADGVRDTEVPPQPTAVIDLLKGSKAHIGQWIQVDVETVRITKILLEGGGENAKRLGQDHYWQLDTFGKIDGRVLIESSENQAISAGRTAEDQAATVEFANRYPVSLVALQLPPALQQAVDQKSGQNAAVTMVRMPLRAQGFYYRQWSYDSELLNSRDGDRQFGPLLMAARLSVRDVGLNAGGINWQAVVAVVFLLGLALIALGSWWVGRRDRRFVQQRRQREMGSDFPVST